MARRARSSSESGQTSAISLSRVTPRSAARARRASSARRRGWAAAPARVPWSPRTQSVPKVITRSIMRYTANLAGIAYPNGRAGRRNPYSRAGPPALPYIVGRPSMNADRKRLVQQSWESISREHDRVVEAFYDRLFEIDPVARSLFARTNMVSQRAKFIEMLGEIVRNLDLPGDFIPAISALGRRHVDYGVREIDYDRVREALFAALEATLGATFTDEVRDAWEEAYALTAGVMKRGAHTRIRGQIS